MQTTTDATDPSTKERKKGERRSPAALAEARAARAVVARSRGIEPIGVSIADAAVMTGESEWTIKDRLRRKIYRAKKSGRRTLIDPASIREHFAALPDARFRPSKRSAGE
jgi:hypothetical protein